MFSREHRPQGPCADLGLAFLRGSGSPSWEACLLSDPGLLEGSGGGGRGVWPLLYSFPPVQAPPCPPVAQVPAREGRPEGVLLEEVCPHDQPLVLSLLS